MMRDKARKESESANIFTHADTHKYVHVHVRVHVNMHTHEYISAYIYICTCRERARV